MFSLFRNAYLLYEGVKSILLSKRQEQFASSPVVMESKIVKNFIEGSDTGNTTAKKLFSAAVTVASKKGLISIPEKYNNPQSIAVIADKTLDVIKDAHDVATGRKTADEVVDKIVKKGAAILKTVTDKAINAGTKIVSKVVSTFVTKVCPPAKLIVPFVEKGIKFVGEKVKKVVNKGIEIVAKYAKPVVRKVVETVQKVGSAIKSAAKKVWNFFFG